MVSWLCLVCFLLAKIGGEGGVVNDKKQVPAPALSNHNASKLGAHTLTAKPRRCYCRQILWIKKDGIRAHVTE